MRARHRPIVEPLEPKLLYSADLAPLVLATDSAGLLDHADATQASIASARHEVVFIDAAVPDLQALQQDLAAQAEAGRDIEVIILRSDEDGLSRITDVLAGRTDVAAIHLISHGDQGQVRLGSTMLDAQALLQRAGDVAQWGSALAADGDLLIYGCDVAASASGQALVHDLAALTGADVAASDDSTGQSSLGGNWRLEVQSGVIDNGVALSTTAQEGWTHTLALGLLPPVITSNGGGSTGTAQVNENSSYVTKVTATSLDVATSSLTYSITGGADAARFRIDTSTGELRFLSAPNFEAPSDSNADNAYKVTVGVSDGVYLTTQALTVNVQNVNEAPVITSDGGDGYAVVQVVTGTTAITRVQALDSEGDVLTYGIGNGLDSNLMDIDPVTGQLSFKSPVDIANAQSSAGNNVYQVVVYARDASGAYDYQWVVIQITDPTPVNQSPVIDSHGGGDEGSIAVIEGQTQVTTVHATDVDSSTLSYSIIGGADQSQFSIDASTGVITFKTTPDTTAPTDADQDNVYELVISASDGNTSDSQTLTVQVLAHNRAPINTIPAQYSAQEDTSLALTGLAVTDVDAGSGVITVSLQVQHGTLTVRHDVGGGLQASQIQYGGSGRQVTLSGTVDEINATLSASQGVSYLADANYHGTDTLSMASDDQGHSGLDSAGNQPGTGLSDTDQASIIVAAVDDAPVLNTNTLSISQGGTATPQIAVSDVDSATALLGVRVQSVSGGHFQNTSTNTTVTQFSLQDLQDGAIVFVHDGTSLSPAYTLVAFDATGDSVASVAQISFNASPTITSNGGGSSAIITIPELTSQVTTVQATDVDSTTLTYAIVGGADQALFTIDAGTGALRFSTAPDITTAPFNAHSLNYTVIVAASDGSTEDRQTLTVTLSPVNRAPVNTAPNSITAQEDTPHALTGLGVTDMDAGTGVISVSLQVQHGTLALRSDVTSGLQASQIQYGNGHREAILTGTVSAINATLHATQGVLYQADENYHGTDTLTMVSNDGGHSGLGSGGAPPGAALSTTTQVAITVSAVNDAPVITLNTLEIDQGGHAVPVLQVNDVDSPTSALILTAQNIEGGYFTHTGSGAIVSQFSLADAQAGLIVFVQDGSTQAPAYMLLASDGQDSTASAASVVFKPTPPKEPDPSVGGPASNQGSGNEASGSNAGTSAPAAESAAVASVQPAPSAVEMQPANPSPEPLGAPAPAVDVQIDAPIAKVSTEAPERPNPGAEAPAPTEAESFQYRWTSSLSAPGMAEELRRNLDALQEQLQGSGLERRHVVASSIALSTGLSVGYVIWLVRGGALLGSMLSAMPAWQMIDPLPVLHRGGGRSQSIDLGDGDATVEHLFDGDAPPPPPPPVPPPVAMPPNTPEARA